MKLGNSSRIKIKKLKDRSTSEVRLKTHCSTLKTTLQTACEVLGFRSTSEGQDKSFSIFLYWDLRLAESLTTHGTVSFSFSFNLVYFLTKVKLSGEV